MGKTTRRLVISTTFIVVLVSIGLTTIFYGGISPSATESASPDPEAIVLESKGLSSATVYACRHSERPVDVARKACDPGSPIDTLSVRRDVDVKVGFGETSRRRSVVIRFRRGDDQLVITPQPLSAERSEYRFDLSDHAIGALMEVIEQNSKSTIVYQVKLEFVD